MSLCDWQLGDLVAFRIFPGGRWIDGTVIAISYVDGGYVEVQDDAGERARVFPLLGDEIVIRRGATRRLIGTVVRSFLRRMGWVRS